MPFHSAAFLLLLLPTLLAYYLRPRERPQHAVLFLSSFAFYAFAGPHDLALLLAVVAANHLASRWLTARAAAIVTTALNLAVLAFYKVVGTFARQLGLDPHAWSIPLGISFYVFQLIAYQVDVARGVLAREPRFSRLLLYVLFFPHHQAGPIMRPAAFLPQFTGARAFDPALVASGARWVLWGLVKKTCADRVGLHTDEAFSSAPLTAVDAWSAALGFWAQIYLDFSGYSDMAVGLGLFFGYRLDRNFHQPYLAVSPSEFWRRWHRTLSEWLRDYLYVPLGGNRRGTARTYVNLMATMLLGGLWHGVTPNFVLWGALHGLLLCAFRWAPIERKSRALAAVLCQLAVLFAWVPFRAVDLAATRRIWSAMCFLGVPAGSVDAWSLGLVAVLCFYAAHALEDRALATPERSARTLARWSALPWPLRAALSAALFSLCALFALDKTTFLYFRF